MFRCTGKDSPPTPREDPVRSGARQQFGDDDQEPGRKAALEGVKLWKHC
jgi:hypothetical protein